MPILESIEGSTPIDDLSGLLPEHIQSKPELNEWEAANILKATKKYLSRRKTNSITIKLIKDIHENMFDETWEWSGKIRTTPIEPVGVEPYKIQVELKSLVDNISYWQKHKTYGILEQSVRIHHRLVYIHSFKNGNGRHARLVSDIFLFSHDHELPKWPNDNLIEETDIRDIYIQALKAADKGNYKLLEKFTKKLIV